MIARAAMGLALVLLAGCANADGGTTDRGARLRADPAAHAAPQTRPWSGPLRPAERPSAADWRDWQVQDLLTGDRRRFRVDRLGSDEVRVADADGCVWTQSADWFAPSDSWARCGPTSDWHTAQARVRAKPGLWPLQTGARGSYRRRAVSSLTGEKSTRTTRCEVTGAEAVLRPGRPDTPAWVVVCDDKRRRSTTWFAPGEGPIAHTQVHERRGVEDAWVRLE